MMTESLRDYLSELGYTVPYNYFDLISFLEKKYEYSSRDALQVIGSDVVFTYQELFEEVYKFSGILSENLYKTDTVCLVWLKDLSFIVANFSIWKVQGATAPLNDLSDDDTSKYIDWISPQLVVSSYEMILKDYSLGIQGSIWGSALYFYVKTHWLPQHMNLPKEVALIAFTSGTTWPSKWVLLSHENLISMSIAMWEAIQESSSKNIFIPVSLSHMYGMSVTLTYLLNWNCISIAQSPSTISEALTKAQEFHIDAIALQPRHFIELIEKPELFEKINAHCRFIACASGNLSEKDMVTIRQKLKTDMYVYFALSEVPRAVFCKNPQLRHEDDIMTIWLPSKFMNLNIVSPRTIHDTENVWEIVLVWSMVALWYIYQNWEMSFFQNKTFHTGDLWYMKHGTYFWYGRIKDIINIRDIIYINPFVIEKEMLKTWWIKECLLMFDAKIQWLIFCFCKATDVPLWDSIRTKLEELIWIDFVASDIDCQILEVSVIQKNKNWKILRDPLFYL